MRGKTMTDIRGSHTEQNLINAFAGESQARNRYTFFAKAAKNEGYEHIAAVFLDTAENEQEHAKLFYKHICDNPHGHVDAYYPFEYGTTEENLLSGVNGEREEAEVLYLNAAKIAKEEGFKDIADTFSHIVEVEVHHMKRYQELLKTIQDKTVFKKDKEETWVCRKCGYPLISKEAPKECPCCHHPQAYFQLLCEKF